MPNTKSNNRRGLEPEKNQNRRTRLSQKSSSFHGGKPIGLVPENQLRRPKTLPELFSGGGGTKPAGFSPEGRPKLTKLLLNVTIQGSLGAVQVIMSPESSVGDLIVAAVKLYSKECRRPMLPTKDPAGFDLHYSQFSLESLEREENLMELGSRNFFLCARKAEMGLDCGSGGGGSVTTSCSKQAEKVAKSGFAWLKFMDFSL